MNKNTIIKVAVIIVAFGSSGLILYNGLFKKNSAAPLPVPMTTPGAPLGAPPGALATGVGNPALPAAPQSSNVQEILPQGTTLDFSKVIDSKRFNYNQFQYPKVDADNEVGIPEENLILPLVPVGNLAPNP